MAKKISSKLLKMNKEDIKKLVLQNRKKHIPKIPSVFTKSFQVDELIEGGCKCYRILPKENFNGTYIIYLYGSNMCNNISEDQWDFIYDICIKTGVGLFVPMYPLAPEHSCRELFNMLTRSYANFAKSFDVSRVVLLGDGAGAGLSLSLAMLAWKNGYRKPDQIIMLSPVLDTEFFDQELEEQLRAANGIDPYAFYNDAIKDFLNTYWVKDYAVKTEYTSPYYEDYTDICDDIVVFSSDRDIYNCYAKAFYAKAKQQGVNIRYYEFTGGGHNFLINSNSRTKLEAREYLIDLLNGTFNASMKDIYPLTEIAELSKRHPDIIKDEWARKFVYANEFDFSGKVKNSKYRKMLFLSRYLACDAIVEKYIKKFPNATVVNVGCRLDNMFKRLDNGRIQWYSVDSHNTMSVRRGIYGDISREKTIGRSIMDFTWIEDIRCDRKKGIIFVFNDALTTFKLPQIKDLFEKIKNRFPGSEIVFVATSTDATTYNNLLKKNSLTARGKIKMSMDDAQQVLSDWRPDYKIMEETPVMEYRPRTGKVGLRAKIAIAYNQTTYNHKVIHVKLGSEAYEISS